MEVRCTLGVIAQRLVEAAEVSPLIAIEKAATLQLADALDNPGGRIGF